MMRFFKPVRIALVKEMTRTIVQDAAQTSMSNLLGLGIYYYGNKFLEAFSREKEVKTEIKQ
ncbi:MULTISPECIES: hypothetical protein [Legionella]|uniref:hypothetical protein n=1 Tax=Legionella TaxID=445 RepID=UPI000F8F693A|nr:MULTISPECIES: hypothetical protein [Legionella]MCP0914820.1 hypothetical protein [Legionella sp. 27cVA30]RUR11485.1 hypothetical protein ELY14_01695 [Legionella septentrionalis]RUR16750.1 hypothetical protein ELY10_02410 [Legionella septentrionalis]